MNSIERFYATIERKPVDRPACWLGDPTLDAVPALCDYYGVKDIKELKRVCGDDFYAVEILAAFIKPAECYDSNLTHYCPFFLIL